MRQITGVFSEKRQHWVGDGFPVRSLLSHQMAGPAASPFLLLDHAGPYQFTPKLGQPRGVGAHPHKGFETVTIVYEGEVEHRDSTGAGGVIGRGDVQWMTAGDGIIHEEFHSQNYTRTGGAFEMVQLWVNLPAADKSTPARYQNLTSDMIPVVEREGMTTRVIAGEFDGHYGPAQTFTPVNVWDVKAKAGQTIRLPVPASHNTSLVVLHGTVAMGGTEYTDGSTIMLAPGADDIVVDVRADAVLVVLSGEPINEPVVAYGPFVMNTEDEIRQAITDFNAGRFGKISA
ncbi:pirin family protein [Brevundimonas sp.]|uniref:pirin family protein n=1 Tax=Brevundimonas sp. TaxID=1871086 RepID=UPI002FCB9440